MAARTSVFSEMRSGARTEAASVKVKNQLPHIFGGLFDIGSALGKKETMLSPRPYIETIGYFIGVERRLQNRDHIVRHIGIRFGKTQIKLTTNARALTSDG